MRLKWLDLWESESKLVEATTSAEVGYVQKIDVGWVSYVGHERLNGVSNHRDAAKHQVRAAISTTFPV